MKSRALRVSGLPELQGRARACRRPTRRARDPGGMPVVPPVRHVVSDHRRDSAVRPAAAPTRPALAGNGTGSRPSSSTRSAGWTSPSGCSRPRTGWQCRRLSTGASCSTPASAPDGSRRSSRDYGGEVVGIDLTTAVDAAYANIGRHPNVHLIQADIFAMPFGAGELRSRVLDRRVAPHARHARGVQAGRGTMVKEGGGLVGLPLSPLRRQPSCVER